MNTLASIERALFGSAPNRLNSRYQALIESNSDCILDCSILDLASHDTRWSFAALKAGARHVLGIEARQSLVDAALNTLRLTGISPEKFTFIGDDVYHHLPKVQPGSIDTVFCFGLFYHTLHHQLLLGSIAALKPRHLLLDTSVFQSDDAVIHVRAEPTNNPANAFPSSVDRMNTSLVGYPSRRAIELMLTNLGFHFRYFDWRSMPVENWDSIEDYRDGHRISLRADLQTVK